jgi:pimeloyl-ACP methyl ester carboxylesterase
VTVPTSDAPTRRFVDTNGVRLQVTEAGPPGAPVVLLAHGFPQLGFSWRHQVAALAEAGYRVLAPDLRGYGGSSKPERIEAYTTVESAADLVGLLDAAGADRAAIVGHDFGATLAWTASLLHPDRFAGVAGLSVPPVPRPRVPTTDAFRRIFGDNFFYILYFQQVGPPDAELDRDPATTLRKLFGSPALDDPAAAARMAAPGPQGFLDRLPDPGRPPAWLTVEEFAVYVEEFSRNGFTAPLNWYRCFDRNWELTATTPAATIAVPTLFIGGGADPTLAYTPRDRVREVVSGPYTEVMIDGAGHWLPEERPREISEQLIRFLSGLEF